MKDMIKINKSKEDQRKDFLKLVGLRGGKPCPDCFDTGHIGWHLELEQYIPCQCLIKKEMEIIKNRKQVVN